MEERISRPFQNCPECGSKSLVTDPKHAEIYCKDCGTVVSEGGIDLGPEWRAFDFEQSQKRARTGAPMTFRVHDKGLGTLFTWSPSTPGEHKLKKWQQRTHIANSTERSSVFALSEMDRMASALKLPNSIKESASLMYRRAMKQKLTRGRSIESITSAILYIICRQCEVPRKLDEIDEVSRVGKKEISRTYRFLLRNLVDYKVPIITAVELVPRFCSSLNLDGKIQSKAIDIIKEAEDKELNNGKGPIGTAAAAIYIAAILCNNPQTQKAVADITGVTEVTVRNRYTQMTRGLRIIDDRLKSLTSTTTQKEEPKADFVYSNITDNLLLECLRKIFTQIYTEIQLNPKNSDEILSFSEGIAEKAMENGFLRKFGIEELTAGIIAYTVSTYRMETLITQMRIARIAEVDRKAIRDIKKLIIKTIEGNQPLSFFYS